MSTPESAERLARLKAGKTAQAQELLRERLMRSAERLLERADNPNAETAIMLAKIRLADKSASESKLRLTETDLAAAIAKDPGNLELRRLRHETLTRLKEEGGAREELRLIDQLVSGKV